MPWGALAPLASMVVTSTERFSLRSKGRGREVCDNFL